MLHPRQLLTVLLYGFLAAIGPDPEATAQGRVPPANPEAPSPSAQVVVPPMAADAYRQSYVLGIGDQLRVVVYGENDLSGVYQIDANGSISLPLIGTLQASGQTIHGLEQYITDQYNKYLRDPKVNLQVTQYRPFFILGEVKQPGSYPFIPGMTVKNAVALAGGYSVRGGPGELSLEEPGTKEHDADENTTVSPGDTIRVGSRLF
jgi:protein involved in polysaccharide export with SLBB domain